MYGLAVHQENRCQSMRELMMYVDQALETGHTFQSVQQVQHTQPDKYITQAVDDDYRTQMADPELLNQPFNNQQGYGYATGNVYTGPVNMNSQQGYNSQNAYRNNAYNQPNPNVPNNYANQRNRNPEPQKSSGKNYTALIVIVSICLVAVIACAVIVSYILASGSFGTNKNNDTNNNSSATQENIIYDDSVTMTNCLNTKYNDAKEKLEGMGLVVKAEYKYDNYYTQDTVCGQSVNAGDSLRKGDTVTLYVSKGPDSNPNNYDQKVVVTASSGSSSGKLRLYNWENGDWKEVFSCSATVGKSGISSNYGEGLSATPKGTFKLGYLIAQNNLGESNWPFYQATGSTCIVDDTSSSLYNQIKEVYNLPSGTGYDQIGKQLTNGNCCGLLFIEHNGNGASSSGVVRGNGSAITICGMNGSLSSTYGCVDIKSSDFYTLMSMLKYSKNPHIELKN